MCATWCYQPSLPLISTSSRPKLVYLGVVIDLMPNRLSDASNNTKNRWMGRANSDGQPCSTTAHGQLTQMRSAALHVTRRHVTPHRIRSLNRAQISIQVCWPVRGMWRASGNCACADRDDRKQNERWWCFFGCWNERVVNPFLKLGYVDNISLHLFLALFFCCWGATMVMRFENSFSEAGKFLASTTRCIFCSVLCCVRFW